MSFAQVCTALQGSSTNDRAMRHVLFAQQTLMCCSLCGAHTDFPEQTSLAHVHVP